VTTHCRVESFWFRKIRDNFCSIYRLEETALRPDRSPKGRQPISDCLYLESQSLPLSIRNARVNASPHSTLPHKIKGIAALPAKFGGRSLTALHSIMGRAAMKSSFCWAVTLVGCLVLSFLYQAESARQNHGLVGKGREHSHHGPHQHHHDSGRPVGGAEQEEFEGDVLPGREESLALAATGSNLQTLEIFKSHRQDTRAGLYDYFTSLFSKQSDNRAEETSVSGRAQTNCHLSPDKNECRTAGGNARADPLATAVRSLGAVFSGKPSISAAQGQEILPADESGKPAEVDPAGHKKGAAGLSLSKPSDAGKKILPAHEGTKPAELDPANHKEWGEPLAEKRILPADEGSKGSSWAGLVPSIVKALASVRTPGHAGIDVSTPSLRRPSADGKKIIPTDEGKGDHPPPQQIGVVGGARTGGAQGDGLSAAYLDTRARMLISAGSPSTSTVAQEFLAAHNAARSQVGVQPINWNRTLAVFAQVRRMGICAPLECSVVQVKLI
jgi:hypothetical protein